MTTNHTSRLDEALIRPGRVDKKVELGLASQNMMSDLFCLVFRPVPGDVAPPEATQSEVLVGEDGKAPEAARSPRQEVERVEQLVKEFAAKVLELKFSLAGILSFLLEYKQSLEEAIDNAEQLISKLIEAKPELPVVSEDIKPEDALPETARASKPESKTEVYISNGL
jgi:chaperone BCS1